MKDEKIWDYSHCNIGHPCDKCDEFCTFNKQTYSLETIDQDEKENENERISESNETGH